MAAKNGGGQEKPRIGITMGDINGVGPEVALKATWDARVRSKADLLLIGSAHVLKTHAQALDLPDSDLAVISQPLERGPAGIAVLDLTPGRRPTVDWGVESEIAGQIAMEAVDRAVGLCLDGELDAIVTAPISKRAISLAGYLFPGHTEFIADRTGTKTFAMMLVSGPLRVGLVTVHLPLRHVPESVTRERILERLAVMDRSLRVDFGILRPRIAVLGLNPHAGDGGVLGDEEETVIRPAVVEAKEQGLLVFGPFAADGFFGQGLHGRYDAVLAMYHDQGLAPFKALSFGTGVNFTAGLPIVRTSPDHGTAFDIAGRGEADPSSMREAIEMAVEITLRRRSAPAQMPVPAAFDPD